MRRIVGPVTPLLGILLVLFSLALTPHTARGVEPALPNGVSMVVDLGTYSHIGSIAPGASLLVHVVVQDLDTGVSDGLRGVQFGLDVDPRLVVTGKYPDSGLFLDFEVAPNEWVMSFSDCVDAASLPQRVLTYAIEVAPGVTDLSDLRIDVTDLDVYGEPILFSHCFASAWLDHAPSGGGVLLNPTDESIAWFEASKQWAVEGQDYRIAWETTAGSSVTLDGATVGATGQQDITATATTAHEIVATNGAITQAQTRTVEVIREPLVREFTAVLDESGPSPSVNLRWDVVGVVSSVEVVGVGTFFARAGTVLPLAEQVVWELRATNEWGTTIAVAELPGVVDLPPIVLDFDSRPDPFVFGEAVYLDWRVFNADNVSITPDVGAIDPLAGTAEVFPTAETTYTLTASNANGVVAETVTVAPGPPVVRVFDALPTSVAPGVPVTISWLVGGADTVVIEPDLGSVDPSSGSVEVIPQVDTTYSITATNSVGTTELTRTVRVVAPEIFEFAVTPRFFFPGAATQLSWSVSQGLSVRIDPLVGELDGTSGQVLVNSVPDSTVFTLTAYTPSVTLTEELPPVVWLKPTLQFFASDEQPIAGETITLSATVYGGDTAEILPFPGAIPADGGEFQVVVNQPTEFTLRATNLKGTSERTIFVEPIPQTPEVSLSVSPANPFGGEEFQITATAANADSLALEPGFGIIDPSGGVFTDTADTVVTYTLTAWNRYGSISVQKTVTPKAPVAVVTALTPAVFPGDDAVLQVVVDGATHVTLDPIFGEIPGSGQYSFTPTGTTLLTLTATNPVGTTVDQATITIRSPLVQSFRFDPTSVIPGESSRMIWSVVGAEAGSIEIAGSDGSSYTGLESAGERVVSPAATTDYTLTAVNDGGTTTRLERLEVVPLRIVSFRAVPADLLSGQTSTLEWEVLGEGTVEILGFGTQPMTGSLVVEPEFSTQYVLVARNGSYEVSESVDVRVFGGGTPTVAWSWSPDEIPGPTPGLTPFVPFEAWIVATGTSGGILGFEVTAVLPQDLLLLYSYPQPPETALNFGDNPGEFIVGTGQCLSDQAVVPLVRLGFLALSSQALESVLMLSGTDPSTFAGGAPGYLTCGSALIPMEVGDPFWLGDGTDPTPVSLVSLDAERDVGGTVRLRWEMDDLDRASGGMILRSTGGDPAAPIHDLDADAVRTGQWSDIDAPDGSDVRYRIVIEGPEGPRASAETEVSGVIPSPVGYGRSQLLPNAPNPFNPSTEIRFYLVGASETKLEIYDASGRLVRNVNLGTLNAGPGSWTWNGTDQRGKSVSSGVYLTRLITSNGIDTRRVALLK